MPATTMYVWLKIPTIRGHEYFLIRQFNFFFRPDKKPGNITDWPDDQCQINSLDQGQCPSNDKQQRKDQSFATTPPGCNITKDPQYAANIDGAENNKDKYVCGAC